MALNIAVIDDSEKDRLLLSTFVTNYCKKHALYVKTEKFCNGEAFLAVFNHKSFDIIFMDIIMDGMDGMATAHRIRQQDAHCLLVFTSSTQAFAVESFRVRAFHYLVKPFAFEQFSEVMDLCDLTLLQRSRFIEVKEGREIVRVLLSDIQYVDYYNHYVQIHTKLRIIRTYIPFGEFSPLLLSYPHFLYCYRNCIVNMDDVDTVDDRDFILHSGERVPIARTLRSKVRKTYADYIFFKLEGGELV